MNSPEKQGYKLICTIQTGFPHCPLPRYIGNSRNRVTFVTCHHFLSGHGSFLMGSHEGVLFRAFFLQAQRVPHCFSFNGERRVSRNE